jgi:hypothetical protein
MRNASWIQRAASLLLGCWLAVFAADPAALHACPVHDTAMPASHASHHGSMPQSAHHCCTCPGACCPAAGARLATSPTFVPARVVAFVEPELAVEIRAYSADVQLVLPPAIGPPAIFG